MPLDYRKPGVYVEESLLLNTADVVSATSTALFVGPTGTGPTTYPVRCNSWSDYVMNFGGFSLISDDDLTDVTSYLPYAVYSYFQNGGKPAYVYRATGSSAGDASYKDVTDGTVITANVSKVELDTNVLTVTFTASHGFQVGDTITITGLTAPDNIYNVVDAEVLTKTSTKVTLALTGDDDNEHTPTGTGVATSYPAVSFRLVAASVGTAGDNLKYRIDTVDEENGVFTLSVLNGDTEVERFTALTMTGLTPGTKKLESTINDPYSGSMLVRVTDIDTSVVPADTNGAAIALTGGADPSLPAAVNYPQAASDAVSQIQGPVLLNLVGYTDNTSDPDAFVVPDPVSSQTFSDRGDVFIINDGAAPRSYNQGSTAYKSSLNASLAQNTGDSYVASFAPWIIIPDPQRAGATVTVPPGGAVAGVISRVDSTIGVFRAPAGYVAQINNAVGVDARFTDSDLGDLNSDNINVIRSVQGLGIAIMGARTRKLYGADRYISGRRTLIYIKESLRRSTQFALFENNDQRLWSQLIMTAERLLRPLWEAGGLRGDNASEAYYIKCDETINTPALMQSGEVRMEIGVALEYPAEFIVIRVTQFESGGAATEVIQPTGPTA